MFLAYIALFFLLLALGSFVAYSYYHRKWQKRKEDKTEKEENDKTEKEDNVWDALGIFMIIVAIFFFGLSLIVTAFAYSDQISDSENITKFERLEKIYEVRADALSQQFATYLADLYPEHERNIFKSINPEGVDIYFVKYPDLKASETILELVAQIKSLQDDRYAQQIEKEKTLKTMRYRKRSPWIFKSVIPEMN